MISLILYLFARPRVTAGTSLVLVGAIALGGCGSSKTSSTEKTDTAAAKGTTTTTTGKTPGKKNSKKQSSGAGLKGKQSARCKPADSAAIRAVEKGLRKGATGIANVQVVKSKDKPGPKAPKDFKTMYFLSSHLDGKAVSPHAVPTWAVDSGVIKSGKGTIVPSNAPAQKFSRFTGASLKTLGIDNKADGFQESRQCVAAQKG